MALQGHPGEHDKGVSVDRYEWLKKEPGPRMLLEALKLIGVTEKAGTANNPEIMAWAKEVNAVGYSADEIAWCGLFMAVVAKRAGKPVPVNPLWARNWAGWGKDSPKELGAVLVFSRGSGGHVGLYVGEDKECYHVLGGNQGDSVSIVRIRKNRLLACRALYSIAKPANVRPVFLQVSGSVSEDER